MTARAIDERVIQLHTVFWEGRLLSSFDRAACRVQPHREWRCSRGRSPFAPALQTEPKRNLQSAVILCVSVDSSIGMPSNSVIEQMSAIV